MSVFNFNSGKNMSAYPQIQSDLTATNFNLHCDPRTVGTYFLDPQGNRVLDVESKAGKIAVEDNICNLTVANLTVTESTSGAGGGVTQIVAGTNIALVTTPVPGSGTGVVTINAGGTQGGLPPGTQFGEYLYYDPAQAPNVWQVDGAEIHIGRFAGQTSQGAGAIAIGNVAGNTDQGTGAIAIGDGASNNTQGRDAVAIGNGAASAPGQGEEAIAIGRNAANTTQGDKAIAIGSEAGQRQRIGAVAIGDDAGRNNQGEFSIAIGSGAAASGTQGDEAVAIGLRAGNTDQGTKSVAIGPTAGQTSQGVDSIAIGNTAGNTDQGQDAVAIGLNAGQTSQGQGAIAIGNSAGQNNQGLNSIAIGASAGANLVPNGIAIGFRTTSSGNNSITLNSSGTPLSATAQNEFIVTTRALGPGVNSGLTEAANAPGAIGNKPTGPFTHYLVFNPTNGAIRACPI